MIILLNSYDFDSQNIKSVSLNFFKVIGVYEKGM